MPGAVVALEAALGLVLAGFAEIEQTWATATRDVGMSGTWQAIVPSDTAARTHYRRTV